MKRLLIFLLFVSLGLGAFAYSIKDAGSSAKLHFTNASDDKGISFLQGSWSAAITLSKEKNKLIFLDCFTSWCGPCKWMDKYSFTNSKVGKYFNENFVNMKLDMEKDREGVRLGEKFNVGAYPTLLFIDQNEKLIRRFVGALKWTELLVLGKEVAG